MRSVNVVIPMAGRGQRFIDAGYATPKPFILIDGRPMIQHVFENLNLPNAKYIAIVQKEHLIQQRALCEQLQNQYNLTFIPIEGITEGALCTCLFAHRMINSDDPLLIANCDQIVDFTVERFIRDCFERRLDGSILTFFAQDKKWSYAHVGPDHLVDEVREKVAISNHATVGIYLFSSGKEFILNSLDMIIRNERVNGEFYVCPVYNSFIKHNKKIGIYEIDQSCMFGIGTPEDLQVYCEAKSLSFSL